MDFNDKAMIALSVPDPELYAMPVQDGSTIPADDLHITLAYLGDVADISEEERAAILDACQTLADTSVAPESLFPASTGVFPPEPGVEDAEVPTYASPSNPEIFDALREDLMTHLAARGVANRVSDKHPVFTPHVTLAYSPLGERPDVSHLPTPLPTRFGTLRASFGDEDHTFELNTPVEGTPLPLTASVRAQLARLALRTENSEDYLTALYMRQKSVQATPAQTRAQAALNNVHSLVDPHYRSKEFDRVKTLAARVRLEADPTKKTFVANRALALAAKHTTATPTEARELAALTASLRALIADGNSSAARSMRARKQLRDRYGQWIEMGGGARFKVRVPGAPGGGTWYHGKVKGFDMAASRVQVELEDGRTVAIPNNKIEQPKAILDLDVDIDPTKAKTFLPKSANRSNPTLPQPLRKADPETEKLNQAAMDALDNIYNASKDQAEKNPTGGHLVRLAVDASNNPDYDPNADSMYHTGTAAPFKGENIQLSTADVSAVRAAYDNHIAKFNKPAEGASEEEIKKALQKAQNSAFGFLSGLYNDKGDDDTKELRMAPAVGTDDELEEVTPDAIQADQSPDQPEDIVSATRYAFQELLKRVPDDSPLSGARDRIESALDSANDRFQNGDDDLPTYLKNLDSIKEYANDQEPAFKAPDAPVNEAEEAFGAFAEDIDDIHASQQGVDEIDAVRSALDGVNSTIEDIKANPGKYTNTYVDDLQGAVNAVNEGISSGKYLNNVSALGNDLDAVTSEMEDIGLETSAEYEAVQLARKPFGDVPEAPQAPESAEEPAEAPVDWTPLTVDDINKMNPDEGWVYDDGYGVAPPGYDIPLPDGNHVYLTRHQIPANDNYGKGGTYHARLMSGPGTPTIDAKTFKYDESPYGASNGAMTMKQAQQKLADWINEKVSTPEAPESDVTPDLDTPENYTDAPEGADNEVTDAYNKFADVLGAIFDVTMGENGAIVTDNRDTADAILNLNKAAMDWEDKYANVDEATQQKLTDDLYSATTNAAEAFGEDSAYDSSKIQALVDAATELKTTHGSPDSTEEVVPESSAPTVGDNAPSFNDFSDVYEKMFEFLTPYVEDEEVADAYDRGAAAANTVAQVAKDLQQGKIDADEAAELLGNSVADITEMLDSDEELADSDFGYDLDSLMGEVSKLQGRLADDGFNPDEDSAPTTAETQAPEPVVPDHSTWDGLDSNEKAAIDDSANKMLNWLSEKSELLEYEPDFESSQGSGWEEPTQAIKDFTKLQNDYADASTAYADNELTHQEFADRLAEISNEWLNSDGFAQLAGMGDADGTMAEEFDTDHPLAAFIESLPGVIDPTQITQTPVANDDPWADFPEAPGRTSPWSPPESTGDLPEVEPLAEWEKKLLGHYDEIKDDVPLLEENAPEAVAPVQKLLNAVDDAMNSNEEPSEKWEDLLDAQNIFLDEVDLLPAVSDDGAAVVDAVKEKVETSVENLEANPVEDADPQVDNSKLQGIIDALNNQDGFIQKILAQSLQEKLNNGEEISEGDLAQVQQFLGTIADAGDTTPEEKADYKLAEDALDVETAVPAEAPEVPEDAPEAPEALPEAPEAPATPAETPATLEESIAAWKTSLQEYLASPTFTGSSPDASMVHGSVHNPLNQKQVENIQDIIDGSGPDGLSAKSAKVLQKALDAHLKGDISDDELIQTISTIGEDYAFKSEIAGRLRGAQSGIQVNKPALVGVLRPKEEYYGDPDDLDATDFYMASPEVVQATLNKILEQSLAGADLESLLDSAIVGTDDAAVSQHIDNAKMFTSVALDALQAGNAEFMISNMRDALGEFSKAIDLRAPVHENDKIIRRLRARRRSLDEVLSAFEGRWPNPVVGGTKQDKHGGYIIDNSHSMPDKNGDLVYPGDVIERTHKAVKGQLGMVVATRTVNDVSRVLAQLDDHPGVYSQGIGNKSFILSAVGPNNPLYHDPSYTGPKVDSSPGTFGNLDDVQKTYADNQAKKGKGKAAPTPTDEPTPTVEAPATSEAPQEVSGHMVGDDVTFPVPGGYGTISGKIINFDSVGTQYEAATVETPEGDLHLVPINDINAPESVDAAPSADNSQKDALYQSLLTVVSGGDATTIEDLADAVQDIGIDGLGDKNYNLLMKAIDDRYKQLPYGADGIQDYLDGKMKFSEFEDDIKALPDGAKIEVDSGHDSYKGTWTRGHGGWINDQTGDGVVTSHFDSPYVKSVTLPDDEVDEEPQSEPFVFDAPTNVAEIMALPDLDAVNEYEGIVGDAFDNDQITESQYNALMGLLNERRDQLNNPPGDGGGGTTPPDEPTETVEADVPPAPAAPGQSVFQPLPADQKGQDGDMWVTVNGQHKWGRYGAAGIAVMTTGEDGQKYVLLGKRGDRDEWYLPGGALDEGESPIQGATREFIEEATEGAEIAEMLSLVNTSEYDAGEIENTDGDHWKYTTIIAEMPSMIDVTVPPGSNPYELGEYRWVNAEDLKLLDDQGSLHAAMSNGRFGKLIGFEEGEAEPLTDATLTPDNLGDTKYDMSGWKNLGDAGGSNGAKKFQDENGNVFFGKPAQSDSHAYNEVLASFLYERMGLTVSQARIGELNGKKYIVSPEVKGDQSGFQKLQNTPKFLAALQDGFAIDAWLGNYDVIGNSSWNVIADENGMPVRIDQGGSLLYRGTGSVKSWWGNKVTELDDMRFGSSKSGSYGNAAKVFGKMSEEQVAESAKKLLDITPQEIQEIVSSTGFAPDVQKSLTDTLIQRRHSILKSYNISDTAEMLKADDAKAIQKSMNAANIPSFNPGQKIKFKDGGATGVVKTVYPDGLVKVKQDDSTDGFATMASLDDIEPADIPDAVAEGGRVHLFTKSGHNFAVGDKVHYLDGPSQEWVSGTLNDDGVETGFGGEKYVKFTSDGGVVWGVNIDEVVSDAAFLATAPTETYEAPPATIDDAADVWAELGDGFATPPPGSTLLKKQVSPYYGIKALVQHPDGQLTIYSNYGAAAGKGEKAFMQNPNSYKSEKGWVDIHTQIPAAAETPAPEAPEATEPIFGDAYANVPEGAEILYKLSDSELKPYLVAYPNGTYAVFYNDGDTKPFYADMMDPADLGWEEYTGPQKGAETAAPSSAPAKVEPYSLPADYGTPPDGSTVLFHDSSVQYGSYIVQEPDGSVYAYAPGGNKQKFADIIKDSLLESLANNDAYDSINETIGNPVTTPATNPNDLGEGYLTPPVGSKLMFEDFEGTYKSKLVQHPDGDYHIYWNDGTSGFYSDNLPDDFGTPEFNEKSATKWTPYNGDGTVTANPMDADVPPTEIDPNAPLSVEGKPISVGDTVKIIKYAKKNRPKTGKVVKTTPDGVVRIQLLNDDGTAYLNEKGKKVYSIAASKNVRHQTVASVSAADIVQDGLPKGLIFTNPDTSSPLYGTQKPEPPIPPGAQGNSAVSEDWIEKADALYKQRKLDKYPTQEPKSVKESSYWNTYYAKVMQGSESDLQWLLDNDYIDQELFNEAKSQQAEYLAKQADLTAAYDKEYEAWSTQFAEWKKAQGGATVVPLAHDDPSVQSWSHSEAYTEMNKQFADQIISGPASSGASTQKSGGWQEHLRAIAQTVGLKKEDIAKQPNISEYAMEVWDKLSGLGGLSSNEGVQKPFRAIMTRRFWQFSDPSGQPIKGVENISSMKNTIQKDFGAMEFTPGSVDDGGKYGYGPGGYDVVVDLVVPAGIKGVWTGDGSWGFAGPNSEMGFIAESGLAMYIWDVEVPGPYLNESGGGGKTFKAKVKASLIPTELYPYMDYFQGNPDSHDVMLPAEAQKIIDQYKIPLGLVEGDTSTNPFENTNDGTVGDNQ